MLNAKNTTVPFYIDNVVQRERCDGFCFAWVRIFTFALSFVFVRSTLGLSEFRNVANFC